MAVIALPRSCLFSACKPAFNHALMLLALINIGAFLGLETMLAKLG